LRAIKRSVDRNRKPGQYLLTGSANIMTLSTVSESLAGRIALHTLHPFAWPELLEKPIPTMLQDLFNNTDSKHILKTHAKSSLKDYRTHLIKSMLRGGYPTPALMDSDQAREQWFSSYRQTYLERDLLNIRSIENLPDFNRLLMLVALRTGRLLNLSDLSRETGLPFTTLRRYMNLLEVTYQISLVRPYFTHMGKRLVKTPKLYFNDTGMASHLIGATDWKALEHQGNAGPLVETWVAAELLKLMPVLDQRFRLYFWRTRTGQEVDFLIERAGNVVAIEVKWGHRIKETDIHNVNRLAEDLKEKLLFTMILYSGTESVPLGPKIVALPFPLFFGI
jgi:predicted AAA+ superfamily ATPase